MDEREKERLKNRPKKLGSPILEPRAGWQYHPDTDEWTLPGLPAQVRFKSIFGTRLMIPLQNFPHPSDPDRIIKRGTPRFDRYELNEDKAVAKIHIFYDQGLLSFIRMFQHVEDQLKQEDIGLLRKIAKQAEQVLVTIRSWALSQWRDEQLRNQVAHQCRQIAEAIGKADEFGYKAKAKELFEKLADSCLLDSAKRVNPEATGARTFWAVKRLAERAIELPAILSNQADERAAAYQEYDRIKGIINLLKANCLDGCRLIERFENNPKSEPLKTQLGRLTERLRLRLEDVRSIIVLPYGETIGRIIGDLLEQAIADGRGYDWPEVINHLATILKHLGALSGFKQVEQSLKAFVKSAYFKADTIPEVAKPELIAALDRIRDEELARANFDRYQRDYLIMAAQLNGIRAVVAKGDAKRIRFLIAATSKQNNHQGLLETLKGIRDRYG